MKRIKKNICFLFILFVVSFPFAIVHADDCSDVMDAVNELETINGLYESLSCSSTDNSLASSQCNDILIQRTTTLEKIFSYNEKKTCPSIDLTAIITEYEDKCSNSFSSKLKEFKDAVMKLFFVSAPFILIIFGSLDFFKIITTSDPNSYKKHRTNFIKRLIAFLLLYVTPFMVDKLFSFVSYKTNASDFICSEEISFTSNYTSAGVTGTYGGYTYVNSAPSASGQAIAEAAKKIKEDAISNNYGYGCNYLAAEVQGTNKTDHMCCAELLGAALYKAGIYNIDEVKEYQTASAPGLGNKLGEKGWTLITNESDLQPGDVLFYEKLEEPNTAGVVNVGGKKIHTCHTDIYYGDNKRVSTGSFESRKALSNFSVNFTCYSSKAKWSYAYRFPGKK